MRNPQALHKEADRARLYAYLIGDEETANRLRQYAAELDAMAEAAEPAVAARSTGGGQNMDHVKTSEVAGEAVAGKASLAHQG